MSLLSLCHGRAALLALAFLVPISANAEVYKWIDEQGNVHFGDKPLDKDIAAKAEAVEIDEAYKPPERSDQERQALQSQQRARSEADRRRREAEEKRLAQENAEKSKRKAEMCAALDADIDALGNAKMINGTLRVSYLTNEEGKPITAAEQRNIVADLRAKRGELGCP